MRNLLLLLVGFAASSPAQLIVHLPSKTNQAFDEYIAAQEKAMTWSERPGKAPDAAIPAVGSSPIEIPEGLIHDWVTWERIPGGSVEKALSAMQNYGNYKKAFGPEVVDSRLLSHDGNRFKAFLQIRRKKVVTALLNSEYDVEYRPLGNQKWAVLSRSTKIAELEDGKELPVGTGHGYLWRLNAYWVLDQQGPDLYIECRAISLTRDIPTGIGWAVKPIVSSLPKESLRATVDAVRTASR